MEEPGFWDNADKANNSMKELKNLKDTVEEYHRLDGKMWKHFLRWAMKRMMHL